MRSENEAGAVDNSEANPSFLSYEDDDEGIGLETNPNYNNGAMMAPLNTQRNPRRQEIDEWDFSNADRYFERTVSDDALSDGTATDVAAPGSTVGDGLQDRIMADFSNEDLEGRAHGQSPAAGHLSEEELPDLIGDDGAIRVNTAMEEDIDDPVAEVRIDESNEIESN